jgi:hypothetical protein
MIRMRVSLGKKRQGLRDTAAEKEEPLVSSIAGRYCF